VDITVVIIPADPNTPVRLDTITTEADGSTLDGLQKRVGGYVDVVEAIPGVDVWVNDEGVILDLPYNDRATFIAITTPAVIARGDYPTPIDLSGGLTLSLQRLQATRLFGDAVITGHDDEGNTTSVPDHMISHLQRAHILVDDAR
jgi:Domain of unknown function (DUF3846)